MGFIAGDCNSFSLSQVCLRCQGVKYLSKMAEN